MMNQAYYVFVILGVMVCLFLLERLIPLRLLRSRLISRIFVNVCISLLAFGAAMAIERPITSRLMNSKVEFGLIHWLDIPIGAKFLLTMLLMDLSFYYWHVANHKIPFLWRFHNVHHIDPDLDVSTGFRFHAGEVALSTIFRVLQVVLIGVTGWTFAIYELVFQCNTLFHHSNIRLPIRLERLLNWMLVTPRMHGIHHSQVRQETNSNFSVVFPWWDQLHRTLRLNVPQREIKIGIPAYSEPSDNTLWRALCLPFERQRDYWRRADGGVIERAGLEGKQTIMTD